MKKITQKMLAFYLLFREHKDNRGAYLPTWRFVGEVEMRELNRWEMASYKCPTRLTDIFQENPNLLDRELVTGKSGAKYYQYRIKEGAGWSSIEDKSLRQFYLTTFRSTDG